MHRLGFVFLGFLGEASRVVDVVLDTSTGQCRNVIVELARIRSRFVTGQAMSSDETADEELTLNIKLEFLQIE